MWQGLVFNILEIINFLSHCQQTTRWTRSLSPDNLDYKCCLFMFSVLWKPIFTMHPQSTTLYLTKGVATVTLICAADGFPRPRIGWLESNSTVSNETVVQNGNVSSLALVFHRIRKEAPKYRCMARNSVGKSFSNEATITIAEWSTNSTNSQVEGRLNIKTPELKNDQLRSLALYSSTCKC